MDWIAAILELTGLWMIGNKQKIGFIFSLLCGICWIVVAFKASVFGLILVVIPAMIINVRNFIRWSKDDKQKSKNI